MAAGPNRFRRFILPGLAFKAFVIGGGYATGRELAEFFLGSGPLGGVLGLLVSMTVWSLVCAIGFAFARRFQTYEYRSFFGELLGPFWIVFEVCYVLLLMLVLAVVTAAAGEIGAQVFGLPTIVGMLVLIASIVGVASAGHAGVEAYFKYASIFIYAVYVVFLVLALLRFGDRIGPALARDVPVTGWFTGGVTYASYNVVAVIAALPFARPLTSRRDALIAGALAGPLALIPALVFFLCMTAFYPEIGSATLPSDYLLQRMDSPWFHILFQTMIMVALVEAGVGGINALNERVSEAVRKRRGHGLSGRARFAISAALLFGSAFVAAHFGLIALVAKGYGAFGYIMLAILVVPLLTIGVWKLMRSPDAPALTKEIADAAA